MNLFDYNKPIGEMVLETLVNYHVGTDKLIHAKQLSALMYNLGYAKPTVSDIYSIIKDIREEKMPKYPFDIISVAGPDGGFCARYKGNHNIKSAPLKQWLGLTRSLMKQGVITKAYYYQVLNELDTEVLSKGQTDLGGNTYKCEVNIC
jgi:hypothetical protein